MRTPRAGAARAANVDLAGLDLLSTAVVVLHEDGRTAFMNVAAEQLFEVSLTVHAGQPFARLFTDPAPIEALLEEARAHRFSEKRTELTLERPMHEPVQLMLSASPLEDAGGAFRARQPPAGLLLIEFREVDQRSRVDREQRMRDSAQANRELVRNLAHEIRNPLGGIRGAAQLLEGELPSPALREYTHVIIREADRLQLLVDRLLAPHRHPQVLSELNIHEVCERVRALVLAEFPRTLVVQRDYDASIPELRGDREQLVQALLNLVRNAAQALQGHGEIVLRTRVARRVTLAGKLWKLALDLHVIDDGPGVPEGIRDRIFFPLVSGREGGTGLGLTLAQSVVQQHGGLIECDSRPGRTDFRVLVPVR